MDIFLLVQKPFQAILRVGIFAITIVAFSDCNLDGCDPSGNITGANASTITLGAAGCATSDSSANLVTGASIGTSGTPVIGDGIFGDTKAWSVTCSGSIYSQGAAIHLLNGGNILVNESGSAISSQDHTISAPGNGVPPVTVINAGTIESVDHGLMGCQLLGGGSVINMPTGFILGQFVGVCFSANGPNPSGGASSLDNSGTITSTGANDAVLLGLGGTVINRTGGMINGFVAVHTQLTSSTISNYGQIGDFSNTSTAVGLGAGGDLNNYAGGQILALSVAVDAGGIGNVQNQGNITSFGARGINMSSGGTVVNFSGAQISGGSRGIYMSGGAGIVTNYGTIIGSTFYPPGTYGAIELYGASNFVTNVGIINGNVTFFDQHDTFLMTGGSLNGQLSMGPNGYETAIFRNVTDTNTQNISLISGGGGGNDVLTFDGSRHTGGAEIRNWETVQLMNGSNLTLSSDLVLGGVSSDTTASLSINSSTLSTLNATVLSSQGAAFVNNSGVIHLTNGVTNSLTIVGNYTSVNGYLYLATKLNGDNSPSAQLILDGSHGSSVSGTTFVNINNVGGVGAKTTQGILIIKAINGATTGPDQNQLNASFSLASPIRAGFYDYILVKGGFADPPSDLFNPSESWFLCSTKSSEVSVYSAPQVMMKQIDFLSIGTLHQRIGEEENLREITLHEKKFFNGVWVRSFGEGIHQHIKTFDNPKIHGNVYGVQMGVDLFRHEVKNGQRNHLGIFTSFAHSSSTIFELDLTSSYQKMGLLRLNGCMGGMYWTYFGAPIAGNSSWYVDIVGQYVGSFGHVTSNRTELKLHGKGTTISFEAGYPFSFNKKKLLIEPEIQLIYLYSWLHRNQDDFGLVSFSPVNCLLARVGVRGQIKYTDRHENIWQPYLLLNLWGNFHNKAKTIMEPSVLYVNFGNGCGVEVGGGFTTLIYKALSLYGEISYNKSLGWDEQAYRLLKGDFGLRINW